MTSKTHHNILIMFVCLAILVRALIPTGFMPDMHPRSMSASNGFIVLTLCQGMEPDSAKSKSKKNSDILAVGEEFPTKSKTNQTKDVPCPFSFGSHSFFLTSLPIFSAILLNGFAVFGIIFGNKLTPRKWRPTLWARGPPLFRI